MAAITKHHKLFGFRQQKFMETRSIKSKWQQGGRDINKMAKQKAGVWSTGAHRGIVSPGPQHGLHYASEASFYSSTKKQIGSYPWINMDLLRDQGYNKETQKHKAKWKSKNQNIHTGKMAKEILRCVEMSKNKEGRDYQNQLHSVPPWSPVASSVERRYQHLWRVRLPKPCLPLTPPHPCERNCCSFQSHKKELLICRSGTGTTTT